VRSRNIKPGFWENEILGLASDTTRLLFIGLWCLADRDGKLEDRPDRIKHLLFGYHGEPPDIHRELTVLSRLGFVKRYEVGKGRFLKVMHFGHHQTPHHTEKKSIIPEPQDNSRTHGEPPGTHGEYLPDSLNPDSLNPSPLTPKGVDPFFQEFWNAYPRKVGKGAARKAWEKKKSKPSIKVVLKAIEAQKKSDQWKKENGQYIPHPATWINQDRWEDEVFTKQEPKREIIR